MSHSTLATSHSRRPDRDRLGLVGMAKTEKMTGIVSLDTTPSSRIDAAESVGRQVRALLKRSGTSV